MHIYIYIIELNYEMIIIPQESYCISQNSQCQTCANFFDLLVGASKRHPKQYKLLLLPLNAFQNWIV